MRIISGNLSGRVIKKKLPSGIRPTKDSVKESVFNMLHNIIDFDGIFVADICAGSGSLGFEAISRGADKCVFVDNMKKSSDFIEKAAESFNLDKKTYSVINYDAISFIKESNERFDLILFDPPYKSDLYTKMAMQLMNKQILKNNGIIIIEMPFFGFFQFNNQFEILKEKISGDTKIIIAKYSN